MDSTSFCEDIESRNYSRDEVLAIISKFQANDSDYLIKTYLTIFDDQNERTLMKNFQRRFNHLIFNNLEKIIEELTVQIFDQKAKDILKDELLAATYISCFCPYKLTGYSCPIIIQFFNPDKGIQHRIISLIPSMAGLSEILAANGVVNKIVGYCGDFSYNSPGTTNNTTDFFTSLCLLNERKVPIQYLPYSDGFISNLFNLLVDYLPENLIVSLKSLGETLTGMSTRAELIKDLVQQYNRWLNSKTCHILLSDYTGTVIEHFNTINRYLEPLLCLPRSIETLLGSVLQRFLLIFIREVYLKVDEIKLKNNCAVFYYHQLVQIRDLFKLYEESHYIPPKALLYVNKQTEELVQNHVLDATVDNDKINELFKEIMRVTDITYTRAVQYIEPHIEQFKNFDVFIWISLNDCSIDKDLVHQTYHIVCDESCSSCPSLIKEVEELNSCLSKSSIFEIEDDVVLQWVTILKICKPVPIITKLLKYLFSLTASYNLISAPTFHDCDSRYDVCKKIIKFNSKELIHEEIVNNIEGFLVGRLDQVKQIIKNNQIATYID